MRQTKLFATLRPNAGSGRHRALGSGLVCRHRGIYSRSTDHSLVEAFKATPEETANASLLLHVVDVSASNRDEPMADVLETVLGEIGADELPQLLVFNKLDLLEQQARVVRNESGVITAVYVSAATGEGLELLHEAIRERLSVTLFDEEITLEPQRGKLRAAMLYEMGAVGSEQWESGRQ